MARAFTYSRCHVNLGAIRRNFQRLGNPRHLMPVIKADAYGHGLVRVARTLADAGAARFAVGIPGEGAALREAGFSQDIVPLMGCVEADDWRVAIGRQLIPMVGNFGDLDALEAALGELPGSGARVAIKCDTGMSRLGFSSDDLPLLLDRLANLENVSPVMLISHLACADMPEECVFTDTQIRSFDAFYNALAPRYPQLARSLGNSAAALGVSASLYDFARPGLALYGGNPFAGTSLARAGEEFEWAMSVSSPILHVRDLAPGQSVSYGRIFTAPRAMRVAVAACGYATGVARCLSNRMSLLVRGRRAPQIGRVCMSMLMLDVSEIPEARPGDLAWIMGGSPLAGHKPIDALELAELLNTIPYEVLCLLGALNPRVYDSESPTD